MRKGVAVFALIIVTMMTVLLIGCGSNTSPIPANSTEPSTTKPTGAVNNQAAKNYEIVDKHQKSEGICKVVIYIQATSNAELIKANDELIKTCLASNILLEIEYFDDLNAAEAFLGEDELNISDTVWAHYIATSTYYADSGTRKLHKHQGDDWITIKSY